MTFYFPIVHYTKIQSQVNNITASTMSMMMVVLTFYFKLPVCIHFTLQCKKWQEQNKQTNKQKRKNAKPSLMNQTGHELNRVNFIWRVV